MWASPENRLFVIAEPISSAEAGLNLTNELSFMLFSRYCGAWSMRSAYVFCVIGLALAASPPAIAQADPWSTMTLRDLEAAHTLIVENHPAAISTVRDEEFSAALKRYDEFRSMAARVKNLDGYEAVMRRFMASFGDRHMSAEDLIDSSVRWPGFLVANTGQAWRSVGGGRDLPDGSILGQCDGKSPEAIANANLAPYVADWSIRAQRLRASPRLLVASDDPFVTVPQSCTFKFADGSTKTIKLDWHNIRQSVLKEKVEAALRQTTINSGITPFRGGNWIRLATFDDRISDLTSQIIAQAASLRSGRFIVIDMRGNGGGSSSYSFEIAKALYGQRMIDKAVQKTLGDVPDPPIWRASPGNLRLVDAMQARFAAAQGPDSDVVRFFTSLRDAMRSAIARGESFAHATYGASEKDSAVQPKTARLSSPPQVYLLTDTACFSACLEAVQLFRALGAIQVGDDTDGGLNYFENRYQNLPSGLMMTSTVQAYSKVRPRRLGPFIPTIRYNGDPADEAAVEDWMAKVAASKPALLSG